MANSIPTYTKIPIPFANSGDKNSIPQNATGSNLASYSEGFPPITSQPITENGIPPERGDFNGLGFSTTNNISYLQQGGLYTFDAQLSSAIGGYAQGAILAYINNGQLYYLRSKINNNTYNFNTNSSYIGQYWEYASEQGGVSSVNNKTGIVNLTYSDVNAAPISHVSVEASTNVLGHVKVDGQTIQIDNNGVIKAICGRGIGEIFTYPSALPPEGAYLLNGQTITNCQTLYPNFWNWLNDGVTNNYIRTLTNSAYEAEIAEYGMCGAFVINGSDVRLPKWNGYQTPLGDSVPVIGNGMTIGLTNGTSNFGSTQNKDYRDLCLSLNDYGGNVGDTGSYTNGTTNVVVGVTEDGTKSGIIVDTSGLYPDRWSWVIQVFNTATDLSNQESAQLASQMQMKAQKDLGNVDNNIDFVVESYDDGQGNWYRVYRSGWVEQGGYVSNSNPNTLITTTFLKSFNNVNYCLTITSDRSSSSTTAIEIRELGYIEKNTTFFTKYLAGKTNYEEGFNWYACGQGEN